MCQWRPDERDLSVPSNVWDDLSSPFHNISDLSFFNFSYALLNHTLQSMPDLVGIPLWIDTGPEVIGYRSWEARKHKTQQVQIVKHKLICHDSIDQLKTERETSDIRQSTPPMPCLYQEHLHHAPQPTPTILVHLASGSNSASRGSLPKPCSSESQLS